jgi:hypothetical protein
MIPRRFGTLIEAEIDTNIFPISPGSFGLQGVLWCEPTHVGWTMHLFEQTDLDPVNFFPAPV